MIAEDESVWRQCPMCPYNFMVTDVRAKAFENLLFDSHVDSHIEDFRIEMELMSF